MNLLYIIIIGCAVGWMTAYISGKRSSAGVSAIAGITGSFIGSVLMMMFLNSDYTYLEFSWWGSFWSLFGAMVLSSVFNLVEDAKPSQPPQASKIDQHDLKLPKRAP